MSLTSSSTSTRKYKVWDIFLNQNELLSGRTSLLQKVTNSDEAPEKALQLCLKWTPAAGLSVLCPLLGGSAQDLPLSAPGSAHPLGAINPSTGSLQGDSTDQAADHCRNYLQVNPPLTCTVPNLYQSRLCTLM